MKTIAQIEEIRRDTLSQLIVRTAADDQKEAPVKHVMVCTDTGCRLSNARNVLGDLKEQVQKNHLEDKVRVSQTGCLGLCSKGPIVNVHPDHCMYTTVTPEDVPEIVESHLIQGNTVMRLSGENSEEVQNFYKKQMRNVLRHCGIIDPENIDEYIAFDGYRALAEVLFKMSPSEVIETVKQSGLRGRGGAGFPTGLKWEFASKNAADQKYVCCNADEGDPGAFMDRSILEGDPHSVVEAMIIAGYAIGSDQGYIYVRAEYPMAVHRLKIAIKQAREYGLLGRNILDSGFSFDLDIRLGAGAFVCGEETALMASIEGKRGEPRVRPPFPAEKGLWQVPTILNNVETFANIALIILKGAEWFSSLGTEKSKGTKVFALGGKITNTGLVEIPMGTTLGEIVHEIGGGIPDGKEFKAALTGGPSGGCIPAKYSDTPIDYESLIELGSMMGSGGLIIMDEDTCMVDIAKFFLEFTVDESCGKCTPCRVGTRMMYDILEKITKGDGTEEDLDTLERYARVIKQTSLCALGQTAPNPVLSTLQYFRDEYEAHIKEKRCPAGVCKELIVYRIDPENAPVADCVKRIVLSAPFPGQRNTIRY